MNKPKAVVMMSGGMDSSVCAAIAQNEGYEVSALHVNYGQRTQERELRAFNEVTDYLGITRKMVVDIGYLTKIGGSSLTDTSIPISVANLENKEIPSSYVPFRNANILAIATSWAEVLGASALFIGAVEEDSSGYPDCRAVFFEAFEKMIAVGTKPETSIRIFTPLIHLSKKEIVLQGIKLNAPLHLTWSCYSSDEEACGVCDSCVLRLRGFAQAGVEDKIRYA
ncbi:MAG: 7-cyano-7-deazaguanine synthase QueC [Ignavibacteriae bacterium]|nr:7-cyano-7-deazaguanine synthase QueC [Ignavibacteriota bacterium]